MLAPDKAQSIFETVRRASTADEVELLISGGRHELTRFANNTIHQNVAEENYSISIRSVFGQRTARATTNKTDADSLRRAVAAAESLARVQQDDEDIRPMPNASEANAGADQFPAVPTRHFAETAAL